jgi:hypothetical protein
VVQHCVYKAQPVLRILSQINPTGDSSCLQGPFGIFALTFAFLTFYVCWIHNSLMTWLYGANCNETLPISNLFCHKPDHVQSRREVCFLQDRLARPRIARDCRVTGSWSDDPHRRHYEAVPTSDTPQLPRACTWTPRTSTVHFGPSLSARSVWAGYNCHMQIFNRIRWSSFQV